MGKLVILIALGLSFSLSLYAARGINLSCPVREGVTIAFFDYGLSTLQGEDYFYVAAGGISTTQVSGRKYNVVRFQNGDDLVFSQARGEYIFFRKGVPGAETCSLKIEFTLPVHVLPRFSPA